MLPAVCASTVANGVEKSPSSRSPITTPGHSRTPPRKSTARPRPAGGHNAATAPSRYASSRPARRRGNTHGDDSHGSRVQAALPRRVRRHRTIHQRTSWRTRTAPVTGVAPMPSSRVYSRRRATARKSNRAVGFVRRARGRRRSAHERQGPLEHPFQSVDLVDLSPTCWKPNDRTRASEGPFCGLTEATQVRALPVAQAQSSSAWMLSRA